MKNSKTKKLLSILLAVMMVVGMIPATAIPVSAATISGATGTGTEDDPVIVDTFDELKAALTYSSELYVQVDTDIECPETINVKGSKTLMLNGKLFGSKTILMGPGSSNFLTIQGTGSMVSDSLCVNALGYVTLKGDIVYESAGENTVFSNTSNLRIEGGTFKNDNDNCCAVYLNNQKAVFAGGSFPGGIYWGNDGTYELEQGYLFQYADGTLSSVLQPKVPVDVVFLGEIDLGFGTQTPAMPEDDTSTYLGDFTVREAGSNITFSFSATPLSDVAVNSNYSIAEKMTVYSTKNGLILVQNSGAPYTIDNTVADVYTVTETLTLMHNGLAIRTLVHIFTVAIHPEGYIADCPIEGATGTGTKEDPVIVDTFEELKAALTYSEELYVQVDTDIECLTTINIKGSKTLTVNSTLYGSDTLFVCYNGSRLNFVLKGMGALRSENRYAVEIQYDNKVTICENLTLISENFTPVTCEGSLFIEGGEFLSNKNDEYSLTGAGSVTFSGGSFPNGIYNYIYSERILADGCMYRYVDGTLSKELQVNVPVDVVNIDYILGFATQTPTMTEGKTESFLGNYTVGTEEAKVTFDFTAKPLPDSLKNAGFTITENLTVISAKNGVIKTQNSGAAYTIDNTIVDTYTVVENITLLDGDGNVSNEFTNVFTVSIQMAGYTPDANCPIEGATGLGKENNPIVVDTFTELKAALEHTEKLYIRADGYIECLETLKPAAGKTLTVNGTLHSENHIFDVWHSDFVLQGNGKITTEKGYCLSNIGDDTKIKGDLKIHSGGLGYHTISASAGNLTISGGTISNSFHSSLKVDSDETVILKAGNFLNGILGNVTLSSKALWLYEDGTLSNELQQNVPVNVYTLEFATQYPAMPEGETTIDLGKRVTGEKGILTVKFTPEPLLQTFIDAGYALKEDLKIYDPTGNLIKSQASGASCQIVPEIEGIHRIVETLTVTDSDGNEVSSLVHTFTFNARRKLSPIVNKDTYFVQSGTTVELEVDAIGDGVTYAWTGVSEGAGGYYTVSDYTDRIQKLEIPESAEGTNKYLVRFADEYGYTAERMITVHISSMGFKEIKPIPTAEEFEAGVTDYGYVFPGADGSGVPKVYFEAYELSQSFIDEGYTMETSLIDYVDGVKVGEGYEAWDYTTHLPGAHEIVQKIVIKDAEGNVFKEYTYTHKMNVMREFALLTAAYGTALYGYRVEVYQDGKLASEQTNGNNITMDVVAPVGDVKIVVSKNGYKAREYEATIPADGFFSLNAEILRWGDANLDDVLDVQDYQQTINKGLSDNHKLDGSYEQSVMDWAEDGYIDVIDCFYCILCINGTELFSASVEYDKYYGTGGETIKISVTAEGFGVTYEWKAPEGAPAIVEGTEDEATVKISIEPGKYNIGDKFTYTCIVRDRFFSYAELEVELEIEHLANLYAVTYSYSSQYEDITGIPGKTRVKAGESITIPELIPQLDGYTFKYWYAGSDRLNPGDTYTPYQNTIIMPYMAKDYTITLHSGIGGEIFGTHKGNYGHYYYLPEMDELPDGYIFYGWTDVEGSTEVKYTTGYRYEIKGDADLYPVIAKADEVTLEIYANDGTDRVIYSTTLAEQNGEIYFTIPEDLEMPTREGYVCTGFITSPDGYYYGVDKYWQGSKVAANPAGVVLYAHWELPNVLQFKGGMDGVTSLPDSVSFESPQSYQLPWYYTAYCDGYEFLYWEDEEGNQYRPEDYVVVHGITTLTAVWEKIDTENYEIWISGQKVSKANPVVQCGTGTARVVEDEWGNVTLVLYDAQITGDEGIRTEYNSLNIEVYGENTITVEGDNARGITGPNGNIQITGTGSLDVNVEGDGAVGISGLYSIDYATVNVNAEPETSDGKAYGVSCLSGSQYRITIDNGATLNAKGTYGIYRAGQLRIGKTSSVYAEGTEYGIYDVREIVDSWGGYSSGTVIAIGDIAAMYFDSSDGFPYHTLTNSEAYYGKNTLGLILTTWDGYSDFIDTPYATYGNKYIEIVPKACTGEHSFITYAGLEGNCEKDGLSDGEYCYNCGYVKTERELIPATGHDYHTHNGKEPTCTEQGVDGTYTQCDKCGEYQGDVTFIDATGHSWGEWLFVENYWYEEYGYGEKLYVRYCDECDEYQETWYWYEDPNDTGSPNDWESGGAGPGKP